MSRAGSDAADSAVATTAATPHVKMSNSVIVGASRGIGLALSKALLHRGGAVIACRKPSRATDCQLQDNFRTKYGRNRST